jgi:hypothetical protein
VYAEESVGLFMHIVQKMGLLRSMDWNEEWNPVREVGRWVGVKMAILRDAYQECFFLFLEYNVV